MTTRLKFLSISALALTLSVGGAVWAMGAAEQDAVPVAVFQTTPAAMLAGALDDSDPVSAALAAETMGDLLTPVGALERDPCLEELLLPAAYRTRDTGKAKAQPSA
jgi:hypothetical protein